MNPAMKNGRCRMHGGLTPRGTDLPQFEHGRYSKSLPDRLVERYETALADTERHDLADEIALAEMKLDDLLSKLDRGESDELWIQLKEKERVLRRPQDSDRRAALLGELLSLIRRGSDEAMSWRDVDR